MTEVVLPSERVIAVGLNLGPFTSADGQVSHPVMWGEAEQVLPGEHWRAWRAVARAADEAGDPTWEACVRAVSAAGLRDAQRWVGELVEAGYAAVVRPLSDDTERFARAHRVWARVSVLGAEEDESVVLGGLGVPVAAVLRPVAQVLGFGPVDADLWSACGRVSADSEQGAGDGQRVLAEVVLDHLPALISCGAVWVDRVPEDGAGS